MSREHKERRWFAKCVESLFQDSKDTWVCKKVVQLSGGIAKAPKEDVIRDTKLRFKALLEYTGDVFTCDRMENKTYQLPFAVFLLAKNLFSDSVAAVASECLQMYVNWDYRARSNILRMILFDDNPEEEVIEKLTIFFMLLEETKKLEDTYMRDCADMSLAEFYPELVNEVSCLDEESLTETLQKIRNAEESYAFVYEHALWEVNAYRMPEKYRNMYRKGEDNYKKPVPISIDRALIRFIKEDIDDYAKRGQLSSYSPFWIFGTKQYQKNLEYIFTRKQIIEAHTVKILNLTIKEKADKDRERRQSYV